MKTSGRGNNKWVNGPAGINCPCCRTGNKHDAKRGDAQARRREGKAEVIKAIVEVRQDGDRGRTGGEAG